MGGAVVTRLASAGWRVSFTYCQSVTRAAEIEIRARSIGQSVQSYKLDVTDSAGIGDSIGGIVGGEAPIDLLVYAAGTNRDSLVIAMHDDDWHGVIQSNLDGAFYCCRAVIPSMIARRSGVIVMVASIAATSGHAGQANYSAAKAALVAFSRSLAREVGRFGIRVNVVAPGLLTGGMASTIPETHRKALCDRIPLRRAGDSAEVAKVVEFLASDASSYITSAVIPVDGGLVL